MRGEAATRTRCSAARWFRSLVLALSKCGDEYSCCRRWKDVVFITGETGGSCSAEELIFRINLANAEREQAEVSGCC